jgi:hypothetical protein
VQKGVVLQFSLKNGSQPVVQSTWPKPGKKNMSASLFLHGILMLTLVLPYYETPTNKLVTPYQSICKVLASVEVSLDGNSVFAQGLDQVVSRGTNSFLFVGSILPFSLH